MKKSRRMKILTLLCIITVIPIVSGCADRTARDGNENTSPIQSPAQENKSGGQEEPRDESAEPDAVPETETVPASETVTEDYGPVKLSQIDYDSFQSRMTDEEWEGFRQYLPVLKENAAFELAGFGHCTTLDRDGKIVEDGADAIFYRYDSEEVTDLGRYVEAYAEDGIEEMMVVEVRVIDLDGDETQELIVEWTPVGDYLILHCEDGKFYGWEIMYRGFEMLQTNGIYISSGGAASNRWKHIRFDSGSWIEEILAEEEWGEYSVHRETVDEDTFWQQIETYESGDVAGYGPKRRADENTGG